MSLAAYWIDQRLQQIRKIFLAISLALLLELDEQQLLDLILHGSDHGCSIMCQYGHQFLDDANVQLVFLIEFVVLLIGEVLNILAKVINDANAKHLLKAI